MSVIVTVALFCNFGKEEEECLCECQQIELQLWSSPHHSKTTPASKTFVGKHKQPKQAIHSFCSHWHLDHVANIRKLAITLLQTPDVSIRTCHRPCINLTLVKKKSHIMFTTWLSYRGGAKPVTAVQVCQSAYIRVKPLKSVDRGQQHFPCHHWIIYRVFWTFSSRVCDDRNR